MAGKDVSYKKVRRKRNKLLKLGLVLILVIGVALVGVYEFSRTHFGKATIQGIDCSWLSVEEVKEKIENSIENTEICFTINSKSYTATYGELGAEVSRNTLEQLLESQNFFNRNDLTLKDGISISKEKVTKFLMGALENQEENYVQPKNAYISFDGSDFFIEKEVIGNQIDYNIAYEIIRQKLTSIEENQVIDLTSAMQLPQVMSNDKNLVEKCIKLNNMLNTVIIIKLIDGSTYTIDKEVIVNWITYDESNFSFNIRKNVEKFVDEINEAAKKVTTVQIEGTGVGYVNMPTFEEKIPSIMKEETISFIMDKLKKGETYVGNPVYEKDPITENLNSYVEIDITRQMVFMYLNGECILETQTVTGNIGAGYYTPTGVFYLNNKVYDTVLRGSNRDGSKYASPVLYWMPFYRGFGMHDANWRNKFGGEIYKNNGSHGCVNLPTNAAKTIYENITYDMPIFIYKS